MDAGRVPEGLEAITEANKTRKKIQPVSVAEHKQGVKSEVAVRLAAGRDPGADQV